MPSRGCGNITHPVEELGILHYEGSQGVPTTRAHSGINIQCRDEPYDSLVPIVPWTVGSQPVNNAAENTYEAGVTIPKYRNFHRWALSDVPLW